MTARSASDADRGEAGSVESDPDRLTLPPWLTAGDEVPDEPAARGVVGSGGEPAPEAEEETLRPPLAAPVRMTVELDDGEPEPRRSWRRRPRAGRERTHPRTAAPPREFRPEEETETGPGSLPVPVRAAVPDSDTTVLPTLPSERPRGERAYSEVPTSALHAAPPRRPAAPPPGPPSGPGGRSVEPGWSGGGLPREVRLVAWSVAGMLVFAAATLTGYALASRDGEPGAGADGYCPQLSEQGHQVGAGEGSTSDPLGTVLAFDHAYYVRKDVDAVMRTVAPSSTLSREALQRNGVDALPAGTRHCVDARATDDPSVVRVTLRERGPDGPEKVMQQRVTVVQTGAGQYGIVSVTPVG